ncbi:putative ribonuclease H-like domain-containing protein [Tanacetum coccineum]
MQKSAFLYGKIEEEVYVCQPPGFEDLDFPDRVYKRNKGDILLIQVYVDDIIFGSTKKELSNAFEKLMHEKFQMSSIGELTFFLGLQMKQNKDGIFISQDKYVEEILMKFGFTESMIGSLMYITSSRPDIMFAVCTYARYQVNPNVSHLHAVKRIFRYLKGQPKLGLWYPKDSPFDLVAYTDSDYVGASLDKKSITGCCQFLRCRLISWQCKKQTVVANSIIEAEYVAASSCCGQLVLYYCPKTTAWNEFSSTMESAIICLATNQKFNFSKFIFEGMVRNLDNASGKILMYPRNPKRNDTQVPQPSGPTDIVAEEDVHKELGDSGGPRCQETMRDTIAQNRFKNVSKHSNDSLVARGEDASQQGRRINAIDADEDITLVNVQDDADNEIFDVDSLTGDEVFVAEQEVVNEKDVNLTVDEVNLAQALAALKSVKPKVKGDVIKEPNLPVNAASAPTKVSAATTTTATIPTPRKGIVITELEVASKLQAEFDEEDLQEKS